MSRNQIERSQIRAMSKEKTHNSDEAVPHFKIKEIDKNPETDAGGDIWASLRPARWREHLIEQKTTWLKSW